MTWEEKLSALQVLADTSLRMRKPGDWYIDARGREIGGDGFLLSTSGNGATPEQAVEDDWRQMTAVQQPKYIRTSDRRRYVWARYMWREVPKE